MLSTDFALPIVGEPKLPESWIENHNGNFSFFDGLDNLSPNIPSYFGGYFDFYIVSLLDYFSGILSFDGTYFDPLLGLINYM